MVYIVDDDEPVRDAISMLLDTVGVDYVAFPDAQAFLGAYDAEAHACLVLDIRMPGMSGLELQEELNRRNVHLPIIFITGHGDIPNGCGSHAPWRGGLHPQAVPRPGTAGSHSRGNGAG